MKGPQPGKLVKLLPNNYVSLPSLGDIKVIHISSKEPKIGIQINLGGSIIYIHSSLIENI